MIFKIYHYNGNLSTMYNINHIKLSHKKVEVKEKEIFPYLSDVYCASHQKQALFSTHTCKFFLESVIETTSMVMIRLNILIYTL